MVSLLAAVLMAAATPRLELSVTPNAKGTLPGVTILVTLINESAQPVEVGALDWNLVPKVVGPGGALVGFSDVRNAAGYAIPQLPPPPAPPLKPGERRVVERWVIFQSEPHAPITMSVPFGGGELLPGKNTISVEVELAPTTRAAWIGSYLMGLPANPGAKKKGETPEQTAERAARAFDAHWAEVPKFWSGHVDSNVLVLEVQHDY